MLQTRQLHSLINDKPTPPCTTSQALAREPIRPLATYACLYQPPLGNPPCRVI